MNVASHKVEGNAKVPVLYTPLGLSNTTWKVAFGDGLRRRQAAVPAGELGKPQEELGATKERFGLASSSQELSCFKAGRDEFWLQRHLRGAGIARTRWWIPRVSR